MARGLTALSSSVSHGRHALISPALGRLWMRRLPSRSNLKCLTAFVTYTSRRFSPASSSALLRTRPAGPTNGSPARSSSFPGCSPRISNVARAFPRPNTACVASLYRGHPRHPCTARRAEVSDGTGGRNRSAPGALARDVAIGRVVSTAGGNCSGLSCSDFLVLGYRIEPH